MTRACRWLLPAAALVMLACDRTGAPAPAPAQARVASDAAAKPSEGMCAEHGVLEAVCTKCNPALIPIFKAKGDWCNEHGFPESFCPICHPERGGRPAADVGGKPPAPEDAIDGTRVRFKSDDSAEIAGIETEPARASDDSGGIVVPGTVVADATRVARVNPRVSGVLQQVIAEVGTVVRRGDALAVITSSEAGASRSHVESAEARVRAARAEHDREQALHDEKIASEQALVAARRDLDEAEAELAAARAEVGVLGEVGALGAYTLRAPVEGVVIERAASVGQLVHSDDALFTIVDPHRLWVELDVPERQLAGVTAGTEVDIERGEAPPLRLRIEFVSPVIDPATRTARARAALTDVDASFRINSRVRARLVGASSGGAVAVGADAVQRIGEHDVVFVRRGPAEFEMKRVEVAARNGGEVVLRGGVGPGDEIATTGSFLLRTEVLKASLGSGCCEVD
jgi:cobalt-zinc-cadmium efflux system membrane fusion protein